MSSYIPPEVVDRIIDYLHNDPKSLNICALVAKDWLPSTRYHRFRSIHFHSTEQIHSLYSQDALVILPYCQEAIICDNSGHTPEFILEAVANAFLTLPDLKCIKLNNRIHAFTSRIIVILSPIANRITTLNLSGALFASSNDFWPLIRSFPNLNTVQACGVTFGSTNETTFPLINTYEPPITTFSISSSRQGFIIDHLINPPFPLRFLKSLEISYIDPNQITLVPLAESIQETIDQLRFSAASVHRADDQRMPEFVSRLANLNTLIMDKIHVVCPGDGPRKSFLWIPLVLKSVIAPIQRLCIELMIKSIDHIDSIDWRQVDHILANQESLRWLAEVSVIVVSTSVILGTIDTEALKAFVTRRLPITSQRGILRCTARKP